MASYFPRKILVTGGAGFIGANFVHYLLRNYDDFQIVNLDLLTYAGSLNYLNDLVDPTRHFFIKGNICDQSLLHSILREQEINTIVHFAAESHVDRSIAGPTAFVQTNVNGTVALLEEARKYWLEEKHWDWETHRFHHISTDEVFGSLGPEDPPFSEVTPYAPNSPYAASKAASDHLVRAYHQTYGMAVTMTNCSNNFGPFQHQEKFIPTIIRACLNEEAIPVYGDGSNRRDWLYVEDHCVAIDTVLQNGKIGETYNIGGNQDRANLDIVKLICSLVAEKIGKPEAHLHRLIQFVADRPGHDWRYAIDSTKVRMGLGWQPTESFESGIRKTIDWYITSKLS